MLDIVKEAAPSIVLLENTPTALKSSMRLILEQLKGDYDIGWGLVSAEDVGYLHKCVHSLQFYSFTVLQFYTLQNLQEGALLLPLRPPDAPREEGAGRVPDRQREARDQAAG